MSTPLTPKQAEALQREIAEAEADVAVVEAEIAAELAEEDEDE
jgi:hypothetical protein